MYSSMAIYAFHIKTPAIHVYLNMIIAKKGLYTLKNIRKT